MMHCSLFLPLRALLHAASSAMLSNDYIKPGEMAEVLGGDYTMLYILATRLYLVERLY